MIDRIQRLTPISGGKTADASPIAADGGSLFGAIFRSAIDSVKETNAEKVQAQYLMATGQLDDPSSLAITATKEAAALDLVIQLRNRALEAYSELTRINL